MRAASCLGLLFLFLNVLVWADDCVVGHREDLISSVGTSYRSSFEAEASLRCLERQLIALDDHRSVFVTSYIEVLKAYSGATQAYRDPAWIERMSIMFLNLYREAFLNFELGQKSKVPAAWREAFEYSQSGSGHVLQAFLLGMNAHIVRDLPFAIASLELDDTNVNLQDYRQTNEILADTINPILEKFESLYGMSMDLPFQKAVYDAVGGFEVSHLRAHAWRDAQALREAAADPSASARVARGIEAKARDRAWAIRASAEVPVL